MRVALLGTRGVPPRYGGFETCVDEVGARLAAGGHEVVVYCRSAEAGDHARPQVHRGMRLVHLPAVRRRSLETLSHTALSVAHVVAAGADVALLFNAANAPLLPALRARRLPVATHVDGLEWRRAKWGPLGRRYYRAAESLAVRWSDAIIADASGIQDYYRQEFGVLSELIAYGAPLVEPDRPELLEPLGLQPGRYHLAVARFEPENHLHVIIDGYVRSGAADPLVVVGSAPYADEYSARLRGIADHRVRFLGGVWDQALLDQLYANALTYLHGHSVGGTNPSLLRAIGASAATNAYDVPFSREVLEGAGCYWRTATEVVALVEEAERDREATRRRGREGRLRAQLYDWDVVAADYEKLCLRLASGELRRPGASGRRSAEGAWGTP
jgi:glycosyltransferase involved in cell wall biosynthesis